MIALQGFSVLRPAVRDGVDETHRMAARALLAVYPNAQTLAEVREAWWRLVEALTAETRGRPAGCSNGHHVSELAWRLDKRLVNGGSWYCRACRREQRRERGWS